METRTRTAVKATLWTLTGLFVMAVTGFLATGSAAVGGALAAGNAALGLVTYVIYERIWAAIAWGRR